MGDGLTIRISGERCDDVQNVAAVLKAADDLFCAVAEEMTGAPIPEGHSALKLTGFHLICDGCERMRTGTSRGWVRWHGLDYCPTCQHPDWASPKSEGQDE